MMRKRLIIALGTILLLSGSVLASPPKASPKTYPTGAFAVGGHVFKPTDILDARAIPDMSGRPSLMVTLTPTAVASIVWPADGKLPCTLDGKSLGASPARALMSDHALQLSGDFGDYTATAALARRISGRDPLPDSEGDE